MEMVSSEGLRARAGTWRGGELGAGKNKDWSECERRYATGRRESTGENKPYPYEECNFFFLLKLFYFNCSYSLFLLTCFAHSFPPGI